MVYNSTYHQQWKKVPDSSATVYGVDFSPDSKYLLTGLGDSGYKAIIYAVETGAIDTQITASGADIYGVDWN